MKKSIFGKAVALLAAGAVAFTAIGCDTGAGETSYLDETPTTYAALSATIDGSVKAKWDFKDFKKDTADSYWGIPASDAAVTTIESMKTSSGTGATLSLKGNVKTNDAVLQSGKNTSDKDDYANTAKAVMALKLTKPANIVIKAKGAGAAEAARYIVITSTKEDGTPNERLAYKDNLASGKDVIFCVKHAPAGTYNIYNNGVSFYWIDCSLEDSADETKKPAQINKLVLYNGSAVADETYELAYYSTLNFTAENVLDDGTHSTEGATWTSSDESVATVKDGTITTVAPGTTVIRARIGRFYDQRTIKVVAGTDGLDKTKISVGYEAGAMNAELNETVKVKLYGSLISADGVAELVKDKDVSSYVSQSGSTFSNFKAVISTAAKDDAFTVTLTGLAAATDASGIITVTIPANDLKSGKTVTLTIPYAINGAKKFVFTQEMATAGTYTVAGSLTLATETDSKLEWKVVTDESTGATLGAGLNARAAKATAVSSCTLKGLAPATYSVKLVHYDNAGNSSKKFVYQVGDGEVKTLASGGVKGADKSVTFEITIDSTTTEFKFASQGTDGLLLTSMILTPQ